MIRDQFILDLAKELIVDGFAGGGGMSSAIEHALGRHVDVAFNHSEIAISMHMANHPQTKHYIADAYEVDPHESTGGLPIGLFHISPDCTDHSQAKGGQPRSRKTRSLSWVAVKWAGTKRPRVITLENVIQILKWCPLIAKRDKDTGRVVKIDGTVAAPGERVPVEQQFLIPDPKRVGQTWNRFVKILRAMGYVVEWRNLCAADYGAPTTRERLFMVARCDGKPIVWPAATHAKNPAPGQKKWRAAAECIDWSLQGISIFDRSRPLAEATHRRIAKGVFKYVLNNANPFIVPIAHFNGRDTVHDITEPLRVITAYPKGGAFALAAPVLAKFRGDSAGGRLDEPLPVITAGGNCKRPAGAAHAMGIVTAHLAHFRGNCFARDVSDPLQVVSAGGQHHGLVTAFLSRQFGQSIGQSLDEPAPVVTAGGGGKTALVELSLSQEEEAGALRVAAFLMRYYGEGGQWNDLREPAPTITTKDRLALVTVYIKGDPYVIVDIRLRMLQPPELYACQGFPPDYIIDRGHDGRKFTKSQQVFMCGNSVSKHPAMALIRANVPELAARHRREKPMPVAA